MGWVTSVELKSGDGKIQPTQSIAFVKVFEPKGGSPIVQIDTYGSDDVKFLGSKARRSNSEKSPSSFIKFSKRPTNSEK